MDPAAGGAPRLARPTPTGFLAMAAAAALVVFLAVRGDLDLSTSTVTPPPPVTASRQTVTSVGPVVLTARELASGARTLGQPVYWIGPREDRLYELSRTTDRRVSVRYVRPGSPPGAADNDAIVVGTYPLEAAYAKAKQAVKDAPALFYTTLDDGGFAVYDPDRESSVYVVYSDLDYQVEVFDPLRGEAQQVVLAGKLKRVR